MSWLQRTMLLVPRVARAGARGARVLAGAQGGLAGAQGDRVVLQAVEQARAASQAAAVKLTNTMTPEEIRARLLQPSFPLSEMTKLLDHDNHQMRADFRRFISEPVMVPR